MKSDIDKNKSDNSAKEQSLAPPQIPSFDSIPDAIEYIIPVEGSLGIFALGAKGLREWRKIRNIHQSAQKPKTDDK